MLVFLLVRPDKEGLPLRLEDKRNNPVRNRLAVLSPIVPILFRAALLISDRAVPQQESQIDGIRVREQVMVQSRKRPEK